MMFSDRRNSPSRPDREGYADERRVPREARTTRLGSVSARAAALVLVALVCAVTFGFTRPKEKQPADAPKIDAEALARMVQSFGKVEKQEHPWGWIRWLMNSKLDPKSEMTFGVVQINAGQRNPLHVHPNCEELLFVLSGSCEHQLGKQKCVLKEGDVIRIPAGVPHQAWASKAGPMEAVIVYSSGERKFQVVED